MLQSRDIVLNIIFCQCSFYAIFYMVASLMHGIFKLDSFDGKIPFHFESFQDMFSNSTISWDQPVFLADFLSLECTFLISPLAFVVFLHDKLWDFAATTVLLHVFIVCIVNLALPDVWEWWISLLIGLVCMILLGESVNYCFRQKKLSLKAIDKSKGK